MPFRKHLPTRTLRDRPDLSQLKRQAKELLKTFAAGDAGAIAEVERHYHGATAATFARLPAMMSEIWSASKRRLVTTSYLRGSRKEFARVSLRVVITWAVGS